MKENKMMSIATHNINIQFKRVLVNHSDVSSKICLETTHRVHNDGLAINIDLPGCFC